MENGCPVGNHLPLPMPSFRAGGHCQDLMWVLYGWMPLSSSAGPTAPYTLHHTRSITVLDWTTASQSQPAFVNSLYMKSSFPKRNKRHKYIMAFQYHCLVQRSFGGGRKTLHKYVLYLLLFDANGTVLQLYHGDDVMYEGENLSLHFYQLKRSLTCHTIYAWCERNWPLMILKVLHSRK